MIFPQVQGVVNAHTPIKLRHCLTHARTQKASSSSLQQHRSPVAPIRSPPPFSTGRERPHHSSLVSKSMNESRCGGGGLACSPPRGLPATRRTLHHVPPLQPASLRKGKRKPAGGGSQPVRRKTKLSEASRWLSQSPLDIPSARKELRPYNIVNINFDLVLMSRRTDAHSYKRHEDVQPKPLHCSVQR